MYTDLHCPNLYDSGLADQEITFPSVETVTDSIRANAFNEELCKINLIMHGLADIQLQVEVRALERLAKKRIRYAKEEATVLALIDYERERNTQLFFTAFCTHPKTSIIINTKLPNPTMEEPFYKRDKTLNELRNCLLFFYILQNIDREILLELEKAGRLKTTADAIYSVAVLDGIALAKHFIDSHTIPKQNPKC